MNNVKAIQTADALEYDREGKGVKPAGSFQFTNPDTDGKRNLIWVCPCGCKEVRGISVSPVKQEARVWKWDGNEAEPTIAPSIDCKSGCRWHGFLEKGVFRSC